MSYLVLRPGALCLALAFVVVGTHVGWLDSPSDGLAVAGFFMLSGCWVARLWDERYAHSTSPLLTFYLSRAWRIYPLAAIGTLTGYAFAGAPWPALVRDLLLLPRLGVERPIDLPLWSLVVEAQFYAVAPVLFAALRRRPWAAAMVVASLGCWVPHSPSGFL
jgi:peptidoglycan/LPS O-acetylase OafA/YrhL